MRYEAITTHEFESDDKTIGLLAERTEDGLKSLIIRFGGSGRTPIHLSMQQLQALSELSSFALIQLQLLNDEPAPQFATDDPIN